MQFLVMHGSALLFHLHPKRKAEGLNNLPRDTESKPESKQRIKSRSPWQVPVPIISFSLSNHSIRLLSKGKKSMAAPEQQNICQPCLSWHNFLTFLCVCWTRGRIPAQQDTQWVLDGKQWRDARLFPAQAPAGSGSAENWDCLGLFCLNSICCMPYFKAKLLHHGRLNKQPMK